MLSIIIPVKNEEELIINSIEKIFDEVKNIDFEIIIIDDFSHDRTLELIDQISKKYKNIKLYKNKKRGLGPLIDLGIEKSSGEFVCIMMSDLSDDLEDLKNYYNIQNKWHNFKVHNFIGHNFIRKISNKLQ